MIALQPAVRVLGGWRHGYAELVMARDVAIRGDTIRLGQLLKLAGVIEGGGDAKAFLTEGGVLVNGEREVRRGRQLRSGDTVGVGGEELRVIGSAHHKGGLQ